MVDSTLPEELQKLIISTDLKPKSIDFTKYELEDLMKLKLDLEKNIDDLTERVKDLEDIRNKKLVNIGNIVDPSVPIDNNEDNNEIVRLYNIDGNGVVVGTDFANEGIAPPEEKRISADVQKERANIKGPKKNYSHRDLLVFIDGVDEKNGISTAGNRAYYLKGAAVFLEFALVHYGLSMMAERGYTPITVPLFMLKEVMSEVAQLAQFDEELYKVTARASEDKDSKDTTDMYLIATSEQPLCALHRDKWISKESLPLRYVGYSTCFRQEVGSHGRDCGGIFRVHQFEKLEQFSVVEPNSSWTELGRMIKNSCDFYESLKIPYRVVTIVSGALNLAAAKKYDLEGWFPGSEAFRELVSCSNCTDYQSRSLKSRLGSNKKERNTQQEYVHMLNGTLCAITRVICCILENYQTDEGIIVPDVLQCYMPTKYKTFIPFVNKQLV